MSSSAKTHAHRGVQLAVKLGRERDSNVSRLHPGRAQGLERERAVQRVPLARHHRPVVILVDRSKRAALEIPRARAREREERNERERRRPAHARAHPRRPNAVRNVVVREDTRAPSVSPSLRARAMVISDETYGRWKSLVPFVYDWFAHTRTSWPSLCARWGETVDRNAFRTKQRVYLTEQTEGTNTAGKPLPNTILVCQAEVLRPRVAATEHMIFDEHSKSPILKKEKALWHPGEVNRMRCVPGRENVLLTHTDAPEVFVFDANGESGRKNALSRTDGTQYTAPTACLRGHTENAEYALAVSQRGEVVASGGKDGKVMIWELGDANQGAGGRLSLIHI